MNLIYSYASIIFCIQIIHSLEEIFTGFHKKWYLFSMPPEVFIAFEVIHNLFWGLVIFTNLFPYKTQLSAFFIALMFANGVQHLVWAGWKKRYVPGLITAPLHILLFLLFYFQLIH